MSRVCEIDICKTPAQIAQLCRIRPQDFDINQCGVPQVPSRANYVDLFKAYPYSIQLGASGSGTDILLDEKRSVDANADFYLYRVRPIDAEDYSLRLQWPNGHYSSNALQPVEGFMGVMLTLEPDGSLRPIRIPAGQSIGIGLQNSTGAEVNVTLIFEGISRFYVKGVY